MGIATKVTIDVSLEDARFLSLCVALAGDRFALSRDEYRSYGNEAMARRQSERRAKCKDMVAKIDAAVGK